MILYHGTTDKKTYNKIMKEGVRAYSYWTYDLLTAITMGGPYIIIAEFSDITNKEYSKWIADEKWQFRFKDVITPDKFRATIKYNAKLLSYNADLAREIRKRYKEKEGKKWCYTCDSYGELTYLDDGHSYLPGGSRWDSKVYKKPTRTNNEIITCPDCKGYGSPNYFEEEN